MLFSAKYTRILLSLLSLLCAALTAFTGCARSRAETSSVAQTTAATASEPTASAATRPEPASAPAAATADEPEGEGHLIEIEPMFQDELESGCEIYAAVTLLGYYGYELDEFTFSEEYLTTSPTYVGEDGVYYGPDLNSAFAGEPELGYGAYAPVLKNAVNKYLSGVDSDHTAEVEKDLTLAQLCERYIINDIPAMVWLTTDMELPEEFITWTVDYADENADTGEGDEISWPSNEHCMLLTGYDDRYYYFADSLEGITVSFERGQCERVFEELGKQAVVLVAQERTD